MRAIIAAIRDRTAPLADVLRLICCEMAVVILELEEITAHPARLFKSRIYKDTIFALRELSHSLIETRRLAIAQDTLDVDGAKFRFVYAVLLSALNRAF
jgi:hypothetical protein